MPGNTDAPDLLNPHILIADDEPSIRRVLVRMLSRQGYRVTTVEDGPQAVEAIEKMPAEDPIHLLVLDAVLPKLDGWSTFVCIHQLQPKLPVLFTSGHAASVLPAELNEVVLHKPFGHDELLRRVQCCLEHGTPEAVRAVSGSVR